MSAGISIFAPSYRRGEPGACSTQEYLPECRYVVAESEAESYIDAGYQILAAPDAAQGNLCRIRNWILDNSPTDRILLLDDDLAALGFWEGTELRRMNADEAMEFLEAHFDLAESWGARFWGLNCIQDKGSYREYTPFSTTNYIGGPFQAFTDAKAFRYDEGLPLKEDYDMTLQAAAADRIVLRVNYAHYWAKQHTNKGGCATYRTMEREREQFDLLVRKWGSKIVRRDGGESQVRRKKEQGYDLNPQIKVPIPGV